MHAITLPNKGLILFSFVISELPGTETSSIELLANDTTPRSTESLQPSTATPDKVLPPTTDAFHSVVDKKLTDFEKLTALNKDWSPPESFTFPLSTFGNQKRSFQRSWLTKYPGPVYSEQKDGAYCKFCVLFDAEAQKRGQILKEPFKNWRKLWRNSMNISMTKESVQNEVEMDMIFTHFVSYKLKNSYI